MKIKCLRIKDFKKIKELEIIPEDNVIVIAGKNASGKTSALDAILWTLGGESRGKKITKPVRKGQEKAEVTLKIDNFIVKKYCKNNQVSHLKITNKDNKIKYPSPQTMLNDFVGKLAFDPLEFAELGAKEQRDLLLEIFGLKEKLLKIEQEKEGAYNERTFINREIKSFEGQLKGLEGLRKDLPKNTINLISLTKKLEKAKDWNDEFKYNKEHLSETLEEIEKYKDKIIESEKIAQDIKKDLKGKKSKDLEVLRKEIQVAETLNDKIRDNNKINEISKKLSHKLSASQGMTDYINGLDENKLKILQDKKVPIKGLSLEDKGICFRGIPFNQLSESEKLKISMIIAIKMNPKLRVIRIINGNLLDDKNMGIIEKMAKKFDFQIWMERVNADKFSDIILEEGEIKE